MKNKITVDRELLLSKLNKAIKFIPAKSLIPQFDNFLLVITGDNMDIVGTDGNTQIKLSCKVESKNDFSICLPAKWLIGNVALYRENEVHIIQKDEKKVEMKCGRSKGNITMDCFAQNFSMMPMKAPTSEITLHQSTLKTGLKSAEKFAEEDSQNANFTAINIAEIGNKIIFTGLTKTLMCRVSIRPMSINQWNTINIPTDTANKAISLLEEKGEITVIHEGEKICFFTSSDSGEVFEMISVTSNIKFPPTEKLFSEKPKNTFLVNTLEFRDAVKRLKIYTEPGMAPKVIVENENGELKLTARDTLSGREGEEFISLTEPMTHPIQKAYANDHFLQILQLVESNDFTFHFSDGREPSFVVPKVANAEEDIFAFLIANQAV